MGVETFDQLAPAGTLTGSEVIPVIQEGNDAQTSVAAIAAFAEGAFGNPLAYAPSAGSVDPGAGIPGFSRGVGRLNITLAGDTTFLGLPFGTDGQSLILLIVGGNFVLSLSPQNPNTAGAEIFASQQYSALYRDALELYFDGGLQSWVVLA